MFIDQHFKYHMYNKCYKVYTLQKTLDSILGKRKIDQMENELEDVDSHLEQTSKKTRYYIILLIDFMFSIILIIFALIDLLILISFHMQKRYDNKYRKGGLPIVSHKGSPLNFRSFIVWLLRHLEAAWFDSKFVKNLA